MNLVIRQYLASLRERGELDAILPDLLSQLGLTVFSRPRRGTRQDGVDVGAVGRIGDGDEKVYLFSIKAGDLTRREWDGSEVQALRPSLIAILDVYVRNRLPTEHRGKPIVVCFCLGGDVREEVRPDLVAFIEKHSSGTVTFEEWNGDKLATLIQACFLREELLPIGARSSLRKALALLDEPGSSFVHFAALIRSVAGTQSANGAAQVTAIRQMSLCLRILFAWCRDAGNTEAAFLASELTLLHGWTIFREFAGKETKDAEGVHIAFQSIYTAYQEICGDFIEGSVLPHVDKIHGLSTAVRGCSLDVNLKLFDLIGRVGVTGLWAFWATTRMADDQTEERVQLIEQAARLGHAAKVMIASNPTLLLPATEDQAIDVAIVLLLLALDEINVDDMKSWLRQILQRAAFALRSHGRYPSTLGAYGDLLAHPKGRDDEYRKEVTAGSILYPLIAVWAALLDDHEVYEEITALKRELLSHCTFQYWFPDESTEAHLYTGGGSHGATLTDVCVDRPEADLLDQLFSECEAAPHFEELSAVKFGWWPLVIVACRHHRFPLPLHLLKSLRRKPADTAEIAGEGAAI